MQPDTLIHAYDLASVCGFAEGTLEDLRPGNKPRSTSHRFAPKGSKPDAVLGEALKWFADRLAIPPRPNVIFAEVPGFHGFMKRDGKPTSSVEVMSLLIGLYGVLRAVAYRRGIYDVRQASAADARAVFLGSRRMKGEEAKPAAFAKCVALGWEPKDTDASDALALLAYGFEKVHPGSTERMLPLFIGGKIFAQAQQGR